jgi:enoyl-CoA hydratase
MSEAPVVATTHGAVGIIELARPHVLNCLSQHCFSLILQGLRRFESDRAIRAVLIRAQGKNFCTGAELGEVKALLDDHAGLSGFIGHGHAVLSALEESRLPVVVAVQGLCLAGGLELMMAADIAFAATTARFGDQHGQFGLVPGWGGTQRLPRIVGLRRAMDLFLSVRWVDAATALDWGLVNYVAPDEALHADALAFCAKLAERSGPGMALIKRLARTGLDGALAAGLRLEARDVVPALATPDVAEGLAAFAGRRPPVFPSAQGG